MILLILFSYFVSVIYRSVSVPMRTDANAGQTERIRNTVRYCYDRRKQLDKSHNLIFVKFLHEIPLYDSFPDLDNSFLFCVMN